MVITEMCNIRFRTYIRIDTIIYENDTIHE